VHEVECMAVNAKTLWSGVNLQTCLLVFTTVCHRAAIKQCHAVVPTLLKVKTCMSM